MKKLVIMSLFLLVGMFSFSQTTVGITGKLNFSGLHNKYFGNDARQGDDVKIKPNIGGGLYMVNQLGRVVNLTTEAEYIRKGSYINRQSPALNDRFRLNIPYAQLSTVVGVKLGRFDIGAGVYGGYIVNRMNIGSWNYDSDIVSFDENDFHRWDWGTRFSGAFDLLGASITAGADLGLNALNDEGKPLGDSHSYTRYKNQNYYVGLRIPFN